MIRVSVRVRVKVRVRVRVGVRVRGVGLFSHTHAYKAGLSGMRFNEGGQLPSRERANRKASSTHVTCHKHTSSSVRYTPPPLHVGFLIPPSDVCVAT